MINVNHSKHHEHNNQGCETFLAPRGLKAVGGTIGSFI